MIDIHDPKGTGYTTCLDQSDENAVPPGESYHIPLGMYLKKACDNLTVAGQCASATHEDHASVRLQTHCIDMGQGVGTAAAMALLGATTMAKLDVGSLQNELRAAGVSLADVPAADELRAVR